MKTEGTLPHSTIYNSLKRFVIIASLALVFAPILKAQVDVGGENIAMGNPSKATADIHNSTNYLMRKKEYVLSYNNQTCNPNWVSWHLNRSWTGNAPREDNFRPDSSVPKGWLQVSPRDYAKSGFDKGHMCNSKDRTRDADSNSATFLMSNMVPQSPKNNEHTWEQLEEYCRSLAEQGSELYIVCGPFGEGGTGKTSDKVIVERDHLDAVRNGLVAGKIVVPAKTWKVVLVLPPEKTNPKEATTDAVTIAVIMPNSEEIDLDWTKYIVTVDDVEKLTGYTFFNEVDEHVAKEIKSRKYSHSKLSKRD